VRVVRIRRYPVKSMLGEDIASAETGYDGIEGDRRLALIATATGKVVRFTVETFARYFIHDPIHHLYDVTGVPATAEATGA
jgi:uncharacterized protein YcbX